MYVKLGGGETLGRVSLVVTVYLMGEEILVERSYVYVAAMNEIGWLR